MLQLEEIQKFINTGENYIEVQQEEHTQTDTESMPEIAEEYIEQGEKEGRHKLNA